MPQKNTPPATAEELRTAILDRHGSLSKRLQQIARYVLDEPNELAIETLSVIAARAGVQPSAIVRFAKEFGYPGASQMQRVFRDNLLSGNAAIGYSDRVRHFNAAVNGKKSGRHAEVLAEFIEGNTIALQNLAQTVSQAELAEAVALIDKAEMVYVVGFRRSFPVASYLAYSLQQVNKRTLFVDGVAGLSKLQMQTIGSEDVLIAVSYQPYAGETIEAVEAAASHGARIISISDSLVSPIAKLATLVLQVRESEVRSFRSLSASICLAQALVIDLAFESSRTSGKKRLKAPKVKSGKSGSTST